MVDSNHEVNYTITVSQLNSYIENRFNTDDNLKKITLKGEVSNFTNHKSGAFYFSLKDDKSTIKATMWKSNTQKVKFEVENGMNLVVTGNVSVYMQSGTYQIICDTIEPDGVGSLHVAYEQLKEKLNKMNYFSPSNKKPLPYLPKNIGVVTSSTGAALQDILNILTRRYPLGVVTIFPTLVQGDNASKSIVSSIHEAEKTGDIDVLIVGRGGGSIEDLWCFNEEIVATAIYNCKIPIISAVGHEIDFTISDMVADRRAPTPSAAAEIVAPDIVSIQVTVNNYSKKLDDLIQLKVYTNYQQILAVYNRLKANSPNAKLDLVDNDIKAKTRRLENSIMQIITLKEQKMLSTVSTLDALSPLKVLTRGYSITYDDKGNIITESDQVNSGDKIITKLSNSQITSVVE